MVKRQNSRHMVKHMVKPVLRHSFPIPTMYLHVSCILVNTELNTTTTSTEISFKLQCKCNAQCFNFYVDRRCFNFQDIFSWFLDPGQTQDSRVKTQDS
ncbi:unnamed protein product [Ambrosiozyma monospora]|uniref:Unnamed protein product n=1 Tax=Ambrosiozyma monospora TaxID=43982 RepID=A0A9W6Z5F5_AMBMO|nr:unnamed protein product [Ambrosiozyma monospora]